VKKEFKVSGLLATSNSEPESADIAGALDDYDHAGFTAAMRIWIGVLCGAVWLTGCARTGRIADIQAPVAPPKPGEVVITPDFKASGKVVKVNSEARFVILDFAINSVPQPERKLNVYRSGLKVGEIKVTGPERDNNTVADLIAGEAQVNDEVRED
jgi:hypothetical protein